MPASRMASGYSLFDRCKRCKRGDMEETRTDDETIRLLDPSDPVVIVGFDGASKTEIREPVNISIVIYSDVIRGEIDADVTTPSSTENITVRKKKKDQLPWPFSNKKVITVKSGLFEPSSRVYHYKDYHINREAIVMLNEYLEIIKPANWWLNDYDLSDQQWLLRPNLTRVPNLSDFVGKLNNMWFYQYLPEKPNATQRTSAFYRSLKYLSEARKISMLYLFAFSSITGIQPLYDYLLGVFTDALDTQGAEWFNIRSPMPRPAALSSKIRSSSSKKSKGKKSTTFADDIKVRIIPAREKRSSEQQETRDEEEEEEEDVEVISNVGRLCDTCQLNPGLGTCTECLTQTFCSYECMANTHVCSSSSTPFDMRFAMSQDGTMRNYLFPFPDSYYGMRPEETQAIVDNLADERVLKKAVAILPSALAWFLANPRVRNRFILRYATGNNDEKLTEKVITALEANKKIN